MSESGSASRPDQALTFELVTELARFLALGSEWDAFFERVALPQQVFQSHVVLRHWARHYLDGAKRLCILIGRRQGAIVMIWPLLRQRRFGLHTLAFMGVPAAQFGDVLVDPSESEALLRAGWRQVGELGADLFELRKLRADSALAQAGIDARALVSEEHEAPFTELAWRVGESGPSAVYPARERSNFRRRLRRLAEQGEIRFEASLPGPEASALAVRAIAMKHAWLQRQGSPAVTLADPRFAAFFRDLARGDGPSPLRVSVIRCGGEAVGIDLSLDCKGRCFGHVLAVDPDYERSGVGSILIHHSFASAKARGNRIFDLLPPADGFKQDHADGAVGVRDLLLPLSFKGRLACRLGLLHWRPALDQAARRLPPGLVRHVPRWNRGPKD